MTYHTLQMWFAKKRNLKLQITEQCNLSDIANYAKTQLRINYKLQLKLNYVISLHQLCCCELWLASALSTKHMSEAALR